MEQYTKIIAVDFDGTLVTNKFPLVGDPIWKNIDKLKEEQKNGTLTILWTCRTGDLLQQAVAFCNSHGINLDAVNESLPHIVEAFGGDGRKVFANEYWDDKAVHMSEKDIGDFSDGYHTFNDLYNQRLFLSAALFNAYKDKAWKSRRHSDGKKCFGGGWFIVGIDTPAGPYTYHYENEHWDKFDCRELPSAPEWDGHTDKDVERLMSLIEKPEESSMRSWARNEIDIACNRERAKSDKDGDEFGWDYGGACYESALRAFESLSQDGHSGFSIGLTQNILNRLIDGKPLTPIEDIPEVWFEMSGRNEDKKYAYYQCKRMYSLFKYVYDDGRVEYHDNDTYYCADLDKGIAYTGGVASDLIHELFPITMPYTPASDRIKVYTKECLTDPKNGDYDTVGVMHAIKPDGERVEINRYFKESPDGWVDITAEEFAERLWLAVEPWRAL